MDKRNKVIIIGAGPAGIAAAIYLKRAELQPVIFVKDEPGGILRNAYLVENYPGFPNGIKGSKLVKHFINHLHKMRVSIIKSEVKNVSHNDNQFLIETDKGHYVSSTVIIATGTKPKKLEISGSTSIEGSRLFYDPYTILQRRIGTKKRIIIIGAGDIAFDYALTFLNLGHKTTILSRSKPKCLLILQKRVLKKKINVHTQCVPIEILEYDSEIIIKCKQNNHLVEFKTDFIIVACGRDPNISFLSYDLQKFINDISDIPKTSLPGLFFAGDVVRKKYRQVGIAIGDGIHAAMMVEHYFRYN